MESAVQCVELLTSDDGRLVEELAERLGEDNAQRQAQEQQMIQAAEAALADADFTSFRAIIVCGEGWNPGVVGLAASRLTEKYHYPSIVLTAPRRFVRRLVPLDKGRGHICGAVQLQGSVHAVWRPSSGGGTYDSCG